MSQRQPRFRPGESVILELDGAPWFTKATFLDYQPSTIPTRPLAQVIDGRDGTPTLVDPLSVQREGPAYQAWHDAYLAWVTASSAFNAEAGAAGLGRYNGPQSTDVAGKALPTYGPYRVSWEVMIDAWAVVSDSHPFSIMARGEA